MPDKTVLSDAHHEMLVKLAKKFGSEKWAVEDPDRVLGKLLERLVKDMNNPASSTGHTLERAIYAPKFVSEDGHKKSA